MKISINGGLYNKSQVVGRVISYDKTFLSGSYIHTFTIVSMHPLCMKRLGKVKTITKKQSRLLGYKR